MFIGKQVRRVNKMHLGGTNTVFEPGKKKGDPWESKQVPNGKIRSTQYDFCYRVSPSNSRKVTKPE